MGNTIAYGRLTLDENAVVKEVKLLPSKKIKRKDFYMWNNNAANDLALNEKLSKLDYKILLYLLGNMDYCNNVYTTITALAEKFDLQRSYVSTSIKRLSELDYIMTGKVSGASVIHLSEHIASKGSIQEDQIGNC